MKDSKTKAVESTRLPCTGLCHSCVIHTQRRQFHRGRQCLPGCVARTDAPVYMRERGGGRRGSSVPRNAISAIIKEFVYYESLKRELKTKTIYGFRCDERLQTKVEESTRLAWTQLCAELEHLKIETRLIDEMFVSEMGEYVYLM